MTFEDPDQLLRDGNQFLAMGQLDSAELCYLRVLVAQPDHVGAQANMGLVKERQGDFAQAEQHYRTALALRPDHLQLRLNLGVVLLKTKRLAEGEQLARQLVAAAPDCVAAWSQLGVLLACLGRDDEAEQSYRRALALAPDAESSELARVRFNLSYVLMRQGRWAEGWPLLQARWQFEQLKHSIHGCCWQGESLAGKALLIVQDAGHGDLLQFCRYALQAKERGARRVAIYCHPVLKPLLSTMAGIDKVVAFGEDAASERWDYWTLPMSLPQWFGVTPDNIPAASYLQADPALTAAWRARLPADGLRVGLAWKGNPNFENDADRSLPSLHALAPLAAAASPALHFVSLQRGAGEEEALDPPQGMALHAIGPQLRDFSYTAAVIANLDLVISVDSAVAHLAGAMGKPVWLLLPDYRCDWRWLSGRTDTPWYPNTRLFRQRRGESWAALMPALVDALRQWCATQAAKSLNAAV